MLTPTNSVLVHCFEGKSRSATILCQYIMDTTKTSLKDVLGAMKAAHADTKPNDGFMQLLMRRERELFGSQSVQHKSTRPEPRSCPKCDAKCGLSAESVRVHIKKNHPGML
jgi:protein-tyrosine phosphatase